METTQKTRQDTREEPQELAELESVSEELMAEVDELLSESDAMLERIDMASAPQELPSMLDMLTDSARADGASIDRVGGQKSMTSNAAAWTIGGRVD